MHVSPSLMILLTRQVLLELAPSYFRYMDHTASKPSVIAKLMGFYTIEIRNLESGSITAKADLLIMENLFYAQVGHPSMRTTYLPLTFGCSFLQKITGTFDLKGIQGRKVKGAGSNSISRTLMDSDWIEGMSPVRPFRSASQYTPNPGQQKALLLLQPHSRTILQEAVKEDANFLSKSNIMDYSYDVWLSNSVIVAHIQSLAPAGFW
jgi:1-phosphatidylinositol-3-phosphate 5-kinase